MGPPSEPSAARIAIAMKPSYLPTAADPDAGGMGLGADASSNCSRSFTGGQPWATQKRITSEAYSLFVAPKPAARRNSCSMIVGVTTALT